MSSLRAPILLLRGSAGATPEEGEELRNGLLWLLEEEDKGGGALKSIPSSSSVYDLLTLTSLLCSHWLAFSPDRREEVRGRWWLFEKEEVIEEVMAEEEVMEVGG